MVIQSITVIGAGQMGCGIAQVCASAGFRTRMVDIDEAQLERGLQTIQRFLDRDVQKGRLSKAEVESTLARISTGTNAQEAARDSHLVIEAATENQTLKLQIFRELDQAAPPETILASNTSSIPITSLAAVTSRPHKVVGMHFMNPVPVMKLVEIIAGLSTSPETLEHVRVMAEKLGKQVIIARKDMPGFIVNRLLLPLINEAVWLVHEGIGTPEDIDRGAQLGLNHPMGPLTLADFVGLDTCLAILDVLHEGYGDPRFRACPLLRQLVRAGHYGKKSGRGFYSYET